MKTFTLIARILLGLVFFVFGLNGFFHFLPMPPMEGTAAVFFGGLMATGYFIPVLAATQTISGALLLAGKFVPLALVMLAPVVLHIFLFHAFVDLAGLPVAIVVGALEVYLAFFSRPYSDSVKQLFRP